MRGDVAVTVKNLVKSYNGVIAVNDISFDIMKGETFALLGPNGAGKTSTLEILEGYRKRSGGEVSVLGWDPGDNSRAFRQTIGLVLQATALEPELSVLETITAFSHLYENPLRVDRMLKVVGLTRHANKRVKALSGGQQRRLEIALGLVGNPEILFLDEPTTGLDPEARSGIWRLIQGLRDRGKTVVLSSHYMEEVEFLADRLAFLVDGEISAIGGLSDLVHQYGNYKRFMFEMPHHQPIATLPMSLGQVSLHDSKIHCQVHDANSALDDLVRWAQTHAVDLSSLTITEPTLEEIYLSLTGNGNPEKQR